MIHKSSQNKQNNDNKEYMNEQEEYSRNNLSIISENLHDKNNLDKVYNSVISVSKSLEFNTYQDFGMEEIDDITKTSAKDLSNLNFQKKNKENNEKSNNYEDNISDNYYHENSDQKDMIWNEEEDLMDNISDNKYNKDSGL